MKLGILADIHLAGYSQDPVVSKTGLSERLHYLNIVVRNSLDEIIDSGIDNVVFLGDTYHTKSIIHSNAQSVLLNIIRDYKDKIHFIILDGNHDMSSKSGEGVSALISCDNEPNVTMIHEPKEIDNIWFVPWNEKTMVDSIKNGSPNNVPYLMAHLGLNEGMLNSGISLVSDIGLKDLKRYKKVYLGHYHKAQELGNTIYVGSQIQMDWGEKHEEKRYLIVDTDKDTCISVPTKGYKKYYEFKVTNENIKDVIEQVKLVQGEGHNFKIKKIEDLNPNELEENYNVIDDTDKDVTNRGITSSMSIADKIDKYLEIKKIPSNKIDLYKSVGLDVINSCYR